MSARVALVYKPWLLVGGMLALGAALVLLLASQQQPKGSSSGQEIVVFTAAGLMKPVEEAAARYKSEYGVTVQIEPDASGTLLSKLRVAPDRADLFLAAEQFYIRQAKLEGLVVESIPVARQRPVIGVAAGNPRKIARFADLLGEGVRVAIPNPEAAAVGESARRALEGTGLWEKLEEQSRSFSAKVSLVGKVTEAAQAVKVGTADAAIVWDATCKQFGLETVAIAEFSKQVEVAEIGVAAKSKQPTAALSFARYLTAVDRGQEQMQSNGFEPIADADRWAERPELTLMAGAMLKPAVDDLVKRFSQREGVSINTIYAGCGIHVAQMKAMKEGQVATNHFPDAYFACDTTFMTKVQQWFEASKKISRNDVVLVVRRGNPQKVDSIADLARGELKIGLGHPANSALGAITDELLKKLKLHEGVYAKRQHPVVHADAGHMLVNQMRTGALDLIVVYRSNVLSTPEAEKDLEVIEMNLPEAIAIQPYAVAKESPHRYLMRRLLDAIVSPASQQHFGEAGFQWVANAETP